MSIENFFECRMKYILFLISILYSTHSYADIPLSIHHQGYLTDLNQNPVNGTVIFTFRIYEEPLNGSPIWEEIQNNIEVVDGFYFAFIGNVTPLPSTLFDNSKRYLAIAINGNSELSPRQQIGSNPYSFYSNFAVEAGDASTLNGNDSSAFSLFDHTHSEYSPLDHTHTDNDKQTLSLQSVNNDRLISISGGNQISVNVEDADASATNEIQTISKTGNTISLSQSGGSVTDSDTLSGLSCNSGEFAKWNGSSWVCASNTSSVWVQSGNDISYSQGNVSLDSSKTFTAGGMKLFEVSKIIGGNLNDVKNIGTFKGIYSASDISTGVSIHVTLTANDNSTTLHEIFELHSSHYNSGTGANNWIEVPLLYGKSYNAEQILAMDARLGNQNGGEVELRLRRLVTASASASINIKLFTDANEFVNATTSGSLGTLESGYLANSSAGHKFPVSANQWQSSSEGLFITSAGNVGIGKLNPQTKLDVNGDVQATSFSGSHVGKTKITCPSGFTSVENTYGQLGCIQTSENSSATWYVANSTCFTNYAGRLPTSSEWYIAANGFDLTNETNNWEWTSDTYSANVTLIGNGAITAMNTNAPTNSRAYRCWITH